MKLLAISGSLRRDSLNTRLLRAAAEMAAPGVEVELLDPAAVKALPLYDADDDLAAPSVQVRRVRDAIRRADAILVSTPEYNGTMPGGLKNVIDWASRPRAGAALARKPAAVIGASPGRFGAGWAPADARTSLGVAGADVLEDELPVGQADEAFDDDGMPLDLELRDRLSQIMGELAAAVGGRVAA